MTPTPTPEEVLSRYPYDPTWRHGSHSYTAGMDPETLRGVDDEQIRRGIAETYCGLPERLRRPW